MKNDITQETRLLAGGQQRKRSDYMNPEPERRYNGDQHCDKGHDDPEPLDSLA